MVKKEMFAPCMVAVLVSYFIIVSAVAMSEFVYGFFFHKLCVVLHIFLVVALISVTKERMDEIRSEEEDDLSKY